jgi:GT2 family glycosyltransferase
MLDRVTAVVVSYNTADALRQSLASLSEADGLEVVVVDNASDDDSPGIVRRDFPAARLVANTENVGFGAAANIGAAAASGELLLFLNPDCVVPPGAVAALAHRLSDDPALGFAGPRILLESGRPDHASLRADPDPLGAALYLSRLPRLFPHSPAVNRYSLSHLDYDQEQELLAGTAACLMVRASVFRAIGGFDEAFFMYGEDLDLCRRLREAGHGGRYVPEATVTHIKGEASRQRSSRMLVEFHRAMWVYYRKHEYGRRSPIVNAAVAAGVVAAGAGRLAVNALRRDPRVSAR